MLAIMWLSSRGDLIKVMLDKVHRNVTDCSKTLVRVSPQEAIIEALVVCYTPGIRLTV